MKKLKSNAKNTELYITYTAYALAKQQIKKAKS